MVKFWLLNFEQKLYLNHLFDDFLAHYFYSALCIYVRFLLFYFNSEIDAKILDFNPFFNWKFRRIKEEKNFYALDYKLKNA